MAVYRTRQVIGGSLFRISLEELGDALQWSRIAALNGLWDPELPAGAALTLSIPPRLRAADSNGGLLGVAS